MYIWNKIEQGGVFVLHGYEMTNCNYPMVSCEWLT